MRQILIALSLSVLAAGLWLVLRHRSTKDSIPHKEGKGKNPEKTGRDLRSLMLTTPSKDFGVSPTDEFPRVYGVLMDWPISETIATIFSSSEGGASLYTTSTFGIIGGEGHDNVRNAAKAFVRAADLSFEKSTPTTEFPYPASDRVHFYLLTFAGVRVIETDLASVSNGSNEFSSLFSLGQAVLTELRLITEKRP